MIRQTKISLRSFSFGSKKKRRKGNLNAAEKHAAQTGDLHK